MAEVDDDSRPVQGGSLSGASRDYCALLKRLTLREKISLLTGETAWTLSPVEAIGLRRIVMSDGGVGIRMRNRADDRSVELLPNPSAVAACWDADAARQAGDLIGHQARRCGIDVLLAPQINLQRTPLAGRIFECFSEDPFLTGELAAGFIRGVQANGVAACPKHYVANECETERTTSVSVVDETTLRETYLLPFEQAVRAGAWTVMAAYNGVDDGTQRAPATEHHHLLSVILKDEWGFDGTVISDWTAARSTVPTARAGLDITMPGPSGPWGDALLEAVQQGLVEEDVVDDKVVRILRLADRVGAFDDQTPPSTTFIDGTAVCRSLASKAMVLLKNDDNTLPLNVEQLSSIALIGPNAQRLFIQGGGSSNLGSQYWASLSEAFASELPGLPCRSEVGVAQTVHNLGVKPERCSFGGAENALSITELSASGEVISHRVAPWDGAAPSITPGTERLRIAGAIDLHEPGIHRLGLATLASMTLSCNGGILEQTTGSLDDTVNIDSSFEHPECVMHDIEGGRVVDVEAVVDVFHSPGWGDQVFAQLRHEPPSTDDPLEKALRAVDESDATILVLGTDEHIESEGWDRSSISLPTDQNRLAEAVLARDPCAVIVINAGAPLELPWIDRARTVLWCWLPGQEGGRALVDVLIGTAEPTGRLPWTLPQRLSDHPIGNPTPVNGAVVYSEGPRIGYRGWKSGVCRPAFPFGHGLGWGAWEYERAAYSQCEDGSSVSIVITNTAVRRSLESVQVYGRCIAEGCCCDRHRDFRLVGHQRVSVDAGQTRTVRVNLWDRALATWRSDHGWQRHSGIYELAIGRSRNDIRITVEVAMTDIRFDDEPTVNEHSRSTSCLGNTRSP